MDAVFDDEVTLRQYAGDALGVTAFERSEQYFSVAMALGSRTLLNVADRAIRNLRRTHPEIPNAFNRKTIADIGREGEKHDAAAQPVPDMDRAIRAHPQARAPARRRASRRGGACRSRQPG